MTCFRGEFPGDVKLVPRPNRSTIVPLTLTFSFYPYCTSGGETSRREQRPSYSTVLQDYVWLCTCRKDRDKSLAALVGGPPHSSLPPHSLLLQAFVTFGGPPISHLNLANILAPCKARKAHRTVVLQIRDDCHTFTGR